MTPVLSGCCRYESLKDGSLTLGDVALLNDALYAKAENGQRMATRGRE